MAKAKTPTPQEVYRQRRQREERERAAYLPPGFINHGNTCFMNSVLQGLIATRLLSDLVLFNDIPPEVQRTAVTPVVSRRSPLLTNGDKYYAGQYAQPEVKDMPIGDSFIYVMARAWDSQALRRRDAQSPRSVLGTLGQKYDQYLDFAQQDAHEFLRILLDAMRMEEFDVIKKRQPPPAPNHHKKRRRTTLTPSDSQKSEETNPQDDELTLMSFADMIFGGQLTSILVCQKCKHVSQTYEEFNDISLSIKPEDYLSNRKRDRFKKMVGRLTTFPGSSSSSSHAKESSNSSEKPLLTNIPLVPNHTIEMLRSSSVPPSPRTERDFNIPGGGHEEPPLEPPRRRSLDVSVAVGGASAVEPEPGADEDSIPKVAAIEEKEKVSTESLPDSDSSHVIVNVTGPDDKHVEFVEPKMERKESANDKDVKDEGKEKEKTLKQDDAWTKLGRRISLNIGLSRGKDKDKDKEKEKKDRERKSRSMDRTSLGLVIKEGVEVQKSISADATVNTSSTSADNTPKKRVVSEGAEPSTSSTTPKSLPSHPIPSSKKRTPSPQPVPSFSSVHRSKSPKPPKPTTAETEYLRKILADVASSSSSNPFAIFKPPLLHAHSSKGAVPTPGSDSTTGATWLGMGVRSFTGIEECLRLFTAVEVLDGENMVGCRRCWKIKNGVLSKKQNCGEDSDPDERQEDGDDGEKVVEASITPSTNGSDLEIKQPRPLLNILPTSLSASDTSTHIPASISTPTVSFYSRTNSTNNQSLSSIPTSFSDVNLNRLKGVDGNDSPDSPSSISAPSEASTKTSGSESLQHGPGGLPIPVISTTAPFDSPTESRSSVSSHSNYASFSDSTGGAASTSDINRNAAYARLTRASASEGDNHVPSPNPRLTQALYGYSSSSGSKDSLVIPQLGKPRYQKRKSFGDTTTDNDSSDDDSDTSVGTSISADSAASASVSVPSSNSHDSREKNNGDGIVNPPSIASASSSQVPSTNQVLSVSQETTKPKPTPQKKPSKPKPVIMQPAYKRYLIATPPPVLVIHLKRFQQTSKTLMSFSHGFKKLDDYVSFPEHLDLTPFLAPKKEDYGLGKKGKRLEKQKEKDKKKGVTAEEGRCMYRLYAVVVHIGNMLGGHYIAYTALPTQPPLHASATSAADATPTSDGTSAKQPLADDKAAVASDAPSEGSQPVERQWAYISDTVVRLTTLEEVLNAKAYICMYERC